MKIKDSNYGLKTGVDQIEGWFRWGLLKCETQGT